MVLQRKDKTRKFCKHTNHHSRFLSNKWPIHSHFCTRDTLAVTIEKVKAAILRKKKRVKAQARTVYDLQEIRTS